MHKPSISIIIPCYNVPEEYITRAVGSVKAQSYTGSVETIIVDDGSDPEYHDILVSLCADQKDILLVTNPRGGVSKARNTGVMKAAGEYIAFLDADDMLLPFFLEQAYDLAVETNSDVVIGGSKIVGDLQSAYTDRKQTAFSHTEYEKDQIKTLSSFLISDRHLIRFDGANIGRGPISRLIRTETATKVLFPEDLRFGEDLVWNQYLLNESNMVCVAKVCWYLYWRNPNSATHSASPEMVTMQEKQFEELERILDLRDAEIYRYYVDRIIEGIKYLCRAYSIHDLSDQEKQTYRKLKRHIYTQYPWTHIAEKRYFHSTDKRQKILATAYRFHSLFYFMEKKYNRT